MTPRALLLVGVAACRHEPHAADATIATPAVATIADAAVADAAKR